MTTKPVSIPGTRRQRITARSGEVLERSYVFLPAETWAALTQLCHTSGRSSSEVIESLINSAARGHLKDTNDATSPSRR